jgi:hypothetical protein
VAAQRGSVWQSKTIERVIFLLPRGEEHRPSLRHQACSSTIQGGGKPRGLRKLDCRHTRDRPHEISLKKCWPDKARARQIFPTGNILSQQCILDSIQRCRAIRRSKSVNERRALVDRLIGHADFYRLGSRQPRERVRLRALTSPGPGSATQSLRGQRFARVIGLLKDRHCFKQIGRGHQDFQIAPIHGHY